MRIILFSWEYPPRIVGKLAEYVSNLATQLVKKNVETFIVTYNDSLSGVSEEANGAKVSRVVNPVNSQVSLITWDLILNQEIERAAADFYYQTGKRIALIDVFDWHFIPAAVMLKNALSIPFVYSVDSLEYHRSPGVDAPFNMAIRGIEWLGFYEATKVTVKSDWMQSEVLRLYKVPREKIAVISQKPNSRVQDVLKVYKEVVGGADKQ